MPPDLFPLPLESLAARNPRHWRSFLPSHGTIKIGFFSTVFFLASLIVYAAFFFPSRRGPSWRLSDWHLPSHFDSDSLQLADPSEPLLVDPKLATLLPEPPMLPSPPVSDVLTLEQIRDIVAPTRGFFSRDYSLALGWNNVSVSCHCIGY